MPSVLGRATTRDGLGLRTRHWPADDPWAALLIVHGLGEQSGRYEHVGDTFAAAGIDTHAYDQRGNGGSDGRRGDVRAWADLHGDLAERLAEARERATAAGGPLVVYGHSLGGMIALGYLLRDHPLPDLAVLSAPALDSALPRWKLALARRIAPILPTLGFPNAIDGEVRSRDPEVGRLADADPLNGRASTARFAAAGLDEQDRIRARLGALRTPTLVLHGLDDGLVPASASEVLEGVPGVERRTYPGLRHELHNEPEGPAVLADIVAWTRDRARLRP